MTAESNNNYWLDTLPNASNPRDALTRSQDVDVAIVGAGYSGLWTAYYLRTLRPDLRIAIVESETAGFGASGRNGGWVSGNAYGIDSRLSRADQRQDGLDLLRAMGETVDEIGRVVRDEGIDCHYQKGGELQFASSRAQEIRIREEVAKWKELGLDEADCHWLEPEAFGKRLRARECLGGLYRRQVAAVHPARLVKGLAATVERMGVEIYERTAALAIESGRVKTEGGDLRAEIIVRATEGYTSRLPGHKRTLLPLHSWILATEPLSEAQWSEIGLERREVFADGRRMVTYGQRTADDRIAFGARGTYVFGSGIQERLDPKHAHYEWMSNLLQNAFPVLRDVGITHYWGGAFGVPRNWSPSVCLDRKTGLAWLGGYVGMGVAASNLAGRIMAELIAGEETERTRLAWVNSPPPRWEPEPLRWVGVAAISGAGHYADSKEDDGRSSWIADRVFNFVTGH